MIRSTADLPNVDPADRTWGRHADGSPVLRLEDMTRRRAAATPDEAAVITVDGTTTFRQLDDEASRVGQALLADGVEPGDRVCYIGENAPSFLAVLYGASKMGAVPTALNLRLSPAEVAWILADAEPTVVVLGRGLDGLASIALAIDGVRRVVTTEALPGTTGYADWVRGVPADDPGHQRGPDETALMFYTSGTTGRPKGIELTGPNIGHALAAMYHQMDLDTDCVASAPVPFFHVAGIGLALIATLRGAALLLVNPTSPADIIRIWQAYDVTHAVAVPTAIQFLLAQPEVRSADWSRLRFIIYGSSPIPEPVLRDATRVFGCRFIQSYGLTESTGGVTVLGPEDHRPGPEVAHRLRSAGRPMEGVPIKVVDPVTGVDLPPGERGEVLIGGSQVMKGYWRNPAATAAAVDEGWLHTGDGGSIDADGYLYLHDRIKDMIVTGGENVYPAEVESVLTGHPAVAQAAVIGVPSDRWGESPFAVVVRKPGVEVEAAELITWVRERIAHFKSPTGVAFVDALPLNASGKLLKTRLRETYATGSQER